MVQVSPFGTEHGGRRRGRTGPFPVAAGAVTKDRRARPGRLAAAPDTETSTFRQCAAQSAKSAGSARRATAALMAELPPRTLPRGARTSRLSAPARPTVAWKAQSCSSSPPIRPGRAGQPDTRRACRPPRLPAAARSGPDPPTASLPVRHRRTRRRPRGRRTGCYRSSRYLSHAYRPDSFMCVRRRGPKRLSSAHSLALAAGPGVLPPPAGQPPPCPRHRALPCLPAGLTGRPSGELPGTRP